MSVGFCSEYYEPEYGPNGELVCASDFYEQECQSSDIKYHPVPQRTLSQRRVPKTTFGQMDKPASLRLVDKFMISPKRQDDLQGAPEVRPALSLVEMPLSPTHLEEEVTTKSVNCEVTLMAQEILQANRCFELCTEVRGAIADGLVSFDLAYRKILELDCNMYANLQDLIIYLKRAENNLKQTRKLISADASSHPIRNPGLFGDFDFNKD